MTGQSGDGGESANGGECVTPSTPEVSETDARRRYAFDDSVQRMVLAQELEASGHGGCAYELETADDPDVAQVAYDIAEHVESMCGAGDEEERDLADRLRAWADQHEDIRNTRARENNG